MKFFRNYTFTWWQIGLLKIYLLVAGLMLGAYFSDFIMGWVKLLFGIFVVLLVYFIYLLFSKEL